MWSDTLFAAEQRHLVAAVVWGGGSLAAGLLLLTLVRAKRLQSPLLTQFGGQMAIWGLAIALLAAGRHAGLSLRDVAGATRLDRTLWFSSGLELGIALAGITMAITAWFSARRLGGVGAGLAIATQGLALVLLDLQLIAAIAR